MNSGAISSLVVLIAFTLLGSPVVAQKRNAKALPSSKANSDAKSPQKVRLWVDVTGKHKVKATFVAETDGKVKLRRATNDRMFEMRLDRLSKKDRAYVASLSTKGNKGESAELSSVEFKTPAGLEAMNAAVSRSEKLAVIGYGRPSKSRDVSTLVILDLLKTKKWRNVRVPNLKSGVCWGVSDSGKFALTQHGDSKRTWTIWDCSKPKARNVQELESDVSSKSIEEATWLNDKQVFIGNSEGRVRLLEIEGVGAKAKLDEVYGKKVGDPRSKRVFAISPNGKYFTVENARKSVFEIYSISNCKKVLQVPSQTPFEHATLTDSRFLGITPLKQTMAWDLRKKRLVGSARMLPNPMLMHFSSPETRLWPLNDNEALFVAKDLRDSDAPYVRGVLNFRTGRTHRILAPQVFARGGERKVWYATREQANTRFQSFEIPTPIKESLTVPGYEPEQGERVSNDRRRGGS